MQKVWRDLLNSLEENDPAIADEMDEIISLMIDFRIDPQRFAGNVHFLVTEGGSRGSNLSVSGGLVATPSIKGFAFEFAAASTSVDTGRFPRCTCLA